MHQFPWEHESCLSGVPTLEAPEHSATGQAEYVWTTVACASGTVVNLRSTQMIKQWYKSWLSWNSYQSFTYSKNSMYTICTWYVYNDKSYLYRDIKQYEGSYPSARYMVWPEGARKLLSKPGTSALISRCRWPLASWVRYIWCLLMYWWTKLVVVWLFIKLWLLFLDRSCWLHWLLLCFFCFVQVFLWLPGNRNDYPSPELLHKLHSRLPVNQPVDNFMATLCADGDLKAWKKEGFGYTWKSPSPDANGCFQQ